VHRVIFQGDDCATNAAAGCHSVPGLQLPEHGLPFFLAALLGHDQNKVEDGENKDERSNSEPARSAATLPRYKAVNKHSGADGGIYCEFPNPLYFSRLSLKRQMPEAAPR